MKKLRSAPVPRAAKIVKHPDILGGEPVVAGTRVPVWAIVLQLDPDGDRAEVLAAFPHLTPEDVDAALADYEAHRDEIERYIAENVPLD